MLRVFQCPLFSCRIALPAILAIILSYAGTASSLESLGKLLLLRETRCPFSSSAGDAHSQFGDNCWIIAVRGPDALGFVLNHAPRMQLMCIGIKAGATGLSS